MTVSRALSSFAGGVASVFGDALGLDGYDSPEGYGDAYGRGGRGRGGHRGGRHWHRGGRGWPGNWWVAPSYWIEDVPWEVTCYRLPDGSTFCPAPGAAVPPGAVPIPGGRAAMPAAVPGMPAGIRMPFAGGSSVGAVQQARARGDHVPGLTDQPIVFDEGPPWPSKSYHVPAWYRRSDKGKVALLRKYAKEAGRDPRLRAFVVKYVLEPKGVLFPSRQFEGQAKAILGWVQDNIAYLNEPGELIQSPWQTLKVKHGDCDDLGILMAAMADSIALPNRFVLAGRDKRTGKPIRWSEGTRFPGKQVNFFHIYVEFGWPPFRPTTWVPAEPTMKVPLGHDVVLHGVPKGVAGLSGPFGTWGSPGGESSMAVDSPAGSQALSTQAAHPSGGLTVKPSYPRLYPHLSEATKVVIEQVPVPVRTWMSRVALAALIAIPVQIIVLKVLGSRKIRRALKLR